jgi:hypothetical protein
LNGFFTGSSSGKVPYAFSFRIMEDYHSDRIRSSTYSFARQMRAICRDADAEEESTETMCRRFRASYMEFVCILQAVEFLDGVPGNIPKDPNPYPQVSVLPSRRRSPYGYY